MMTDGNPNEIGGSGTAFTGSEVFDEVGPPPASMGFSYEAKPPSGPPVQSQPAEVQPTGQGVLIPPDGQIPGAIEVDMTVLPQGQQGAIYRWAPSTAGEEIQLLEWHQNVEPPAVPGAQGWRIDGQGQRHPVAGTVAYVGPAETDGTIPEPPEPQPPQQQT